MRERIQKTRLFMAFSGVLIVLSLLQPCFVAACCNDFWSCAAAIATGGVSCAIEDFINTVKTMIASVQTLQATITKDVNDVIAASKQAVATVASDLTKLVQMAQNDFNAALASAQQLSNTVQAQTAATNASAIDAKLRETLPRAKAEIENLRPAVMGNADIVRQAAATAQTQVQAQVQAANNLAQAALAAPLQSVMDILNNLLAHPEQIMDPHALVDSIILSVTVKMAAIMDTMTNMLINNANATLEDARMPAQLAMDQAARAKQIFQAMQLANSQRNQGGIDMLLALLPAQPVTTGFAPTTGTMAGGSTTIVGTPAGNAGSGSSAAGGAGAGIRARNVISIPAHQKMTGDALSKIGTARSQGQVLAAKWKASLDRSWADLKNKHESVLHPVLPAGANNSLKTFGDSMLANLDRAQLEANRGKLIAEARRRFATDPRTLAKVELLLGQEIDRRQAVLPKVPPAGPR